MFELFPPSYPTLSSFLPPREAGTLRARSLTVVGMGEVSRRLHVGFVSISALLEMARKTRIATNISQSEHFGMDVLTRSGTIHYFSEIKICAPQCGQSHSAITESSN